jgi:predicted nucleic-acid-binding Zn-ribbon protein
MFATALKTILKGGNLSEGLIIKEWLEVQGVNIVKCPKCGDEMEIKSGQWDHNLTVKAGLFGMKRPVMYVCKQCGYIEFYLKSFSTSCKSR